MIKNCIICENEFTRRGKTCSLECSKINCENYQKEYKNKYNIVNKEKNRDISNEYYQQNKENKKNYYQQNKEKIKQYNKENKTKRNLREKKRRNNDLDYKMLDILRSRIYCALNKNIRSLSSEKLLGLSIKKYKIYLGQQFDENMSWDNYGTYWEIDHIIPLNTFNLQTEKEQLKAFNHKNTRPLECSVNRSRPKDGSDIGIKMNIKINKLMVI